MADTSWEPIEKDLDQLMQEQAKQKEDKTMETSKLIEALRQHESGCISCGYEHNCPVNGCVLMQQAADTLERFVTLESKVPLTVEQRQAYEWAIAQDYPSVAARNAKALANYIEGIGIAARKPEKTDAP